MLTHRPNPYLDHLLSPDGREILHKRLFSLLPDQLPQYPARWSDTVGTYYLFDLFSRLLNLSPHDEIIVSPDQYCPSYKSLSHSHDYFELVYVYSGHCLTLVSGTPTMLSAGDICLYDMQAIHKVEFQKPGDAIFNIMISKELFRRFLLDLLADSDDVSSFFLNSLYNRKSSVSCIHLKAQTEHPCEALAQQIVETYYKKPPLYRSTMKAQLILLLAEISLQYRDDLTRDCQDVSSDFSIQDIISYISNHLQDVTLEDTAKHFGYSPRSMRRLLQKNVGASFQDIVQDARFTRARSMLQDTCMAIDEIAAATGYERRSSFESAFKKYCHITPAAYRKQFFKG